VVIEKRERPVEFTDPTGLGPEDEDPNWNGEIAHAAGDPRRGITKINLSGINDLVSVSEDVAKLSLPFVRDQMAVGRSAIQVAKELVYDASTPGLGADATSKLLSISVDALKAGRKTLLSSMRLEDVSKVVGRAAVPVSIGLSVLDVSITGAQEGAESAMNKAIDTGFGYLGSAAGVALGSFAGIPGQTVGSLVLGKAAELGSRTLIRPLATKASENLISVSNDMEKKFGSFAPLFTPRLFGGY
jgi:hypothetical protein